MTNSIDQALVEQYSETVHVLAQQMTSRLRNTPAVMVKSVTGKNFYYDRLGNSESIEITTRHADTVAQDVEHSRRMGVIRPYIHTFYLDDIDDLETIIDPQSEYARNTVMAMNRRMDRVIKDAAVGTVLTGRQGATSVTAATDGVTTVAAGGTGMTYEKLVEVLGNFNDNEIGNEADPYYALLVTGRQHEDLLKEVELTSADYGAGTPVANGKMTMAAGFEVIKFGSAVDNALLDVSGTTRDCIAMAENAVCVGITKDIEVNIDRRPDKNNLIQVQTKLYFGALRTEGVRVQIVQADES